MNDIGVGRGTSSSAVTARATEVLGTYPACRINLSAVASDMPANIAASVGDFPARIASQKASRTASEYRMPKCFVLV